MEKELFLNVSFISIVDFFCMFVWVSYGFQQAVHKEVTAFKKMVNESDFLVEKIVEIDSQNMTKDYIRLMNKQQQVYIEIEQDDITIFSSIPERSFDKINFKINQIKLNKEGSIPYLFYRKSLFVENNEVTIYYAKDIAKIYQEQRYRVINGFLISTLFSLLIGWIIYCQLKKMYKPIQNLSHELRTPLTLISGYSELLLRVKISEEEQMKLSQEILIESKKIQEIVEQLLIMGDLKDGELSKKELRISELVGELRGKYPFFEIIIFNEETILGNKVLLIRLVDNLLDNAFKAGNQVVVEIRGKELIILNDGEEIAQLQLKKMNHGKPLLTSEYQGSGQGFIICYDIVQLHQGKIRILSDEKETKVVVSF